MFANEVLPDEFDEEPMFTYQGINGATWITHIATTIFIRKFNDNGRNCLKISDFYEEANHNIPYSKTKYADLPLPV